MKVIAIRPEPGLSATVEAGRQLGLDMLGSPLFAIEPVDWVVPDVSQYDGILIGSANAMRHGGAGLHQLQTLPAHVVGEKTAFAARQSGFDVVTTGQGGLQAVLDSIAAPNQRLLRLAGESHVPLETPLSCVIDTLVLYRAQSLPMPMELQNELVGGAVVLLHSGDAARHFSRECRRLSVDPTKVCVAALAPRIAREAGPGWKCVEIAPAVTETALLALARDMCQ